MKITLTPTEHKLGERYPNRRVEISVPNDELNIDDVFDDLVIPALIAWGFQPETVNKYLSES